MIRFKDIVESNGNDPQYHYDKITQIKIAIETNPKWAKGSLSNMKRRLTSHRKKYYELTGKNAP